MFIVVAIMYGQLLGGVPNPGFCWFLYFFGMGRNFRAQGQEKFDILVIRHKTKQGRMWLVIKNGRLCLSHKKIFEF